MTTRTAWLHVGLPHSGVRGLGRELGRHAGTLEGCGFTVPLPGTAAADLAAADLLHDHRAHGWRRREVEGTWARAAHRAWKGRRTPVLACERLATAPAATVDLALDALAGFRPHAVVALRDPGTLLVEQWLEQARLGRAGSLGRWAERVAAADPDDDPARAARSVLDVPAALRTWVDALGPEAVHVVVLPPDHDPADSLWRASMVLLGLGHELAGPGASPAWPGLPPVLRADAEVRAERWTAAIEGLGVDVLGDLAHLRPLADAPGRPTPAELLPPEPARWLAPA